MTMLHSLLDRLRGNSVTPHLAGIFLCPEAGAAMESVATVEAIAGHGLRGDRYFYQNGHWHRVESCTVTMITEDDLERAERLAPAPVHLHAGEHRRNLLLSGIRTADLENRNFSIGSVQFEFWKPRPPCGYLNQITGEPLTTAFRRGSGACLLIRTGGILRVGDPLILDA